MGFEWVNEIIPAAEMVEGPYYGRGGPDRSDIRGDRAGLRFDLAIKVVDHRTHAALPGLKVDLWHCDATGHYSGYAFDPDAQPKDVTYQDPTNDEDWLRGAQATGADGIARFVTIFPGWYASRAPHMHLKVFDGATCILTSQLYLPDEVTTKVYATEADYARTITQDSHVATDTVIAMTPEPVDGCWVELRRVGDVFHGESLLAVDRTAESVRFPVPEGFQPPLGGIPHQQKVR